MVIAMMTSSFCVVMKIMSILSYVVNPIIVDEKL